MPSRRDSSFIRRKAIRHLPYSATELNHERLPDKEQLRNMALNFREQPFSLEERKRFVDVGVVMILGIAVLFTWAILALPTILPSILTVLRNTHGLLVISGTIFSLCAGIIVLAVAVFPPSGIRASFLALLLILIPIGFLNWRFGEIVAAWGALTSLVLSVLTFGRMPWKFYKEFLLTDFRLQPENTLASRQSNPTPPFIFLVACGAVLLPPFASAPYASLFMLAVALFLSVSLISEARVVLTEYLTYSGDSGAPGVWMPLDGLTARTGSLYLIAASLIAVLCLFLKGKYGGENISALIVLVPGSILLSVVLLTALFAPTFFSTRQLRQLIEREIQNDKRTWWQRFSDRVQFSTHSSTDPVKKQTIREADHLFLGEEPALKFPILIHKELLAQHAYIVGRTGSGKTSIGLMQILLQAIRGFGPPANKSKSPVIILDFKGDSVLFQTAKKEAENRGQPFRFFTLEKGISSHFFNPFRGFQSKTRSLPQLVQLVLDSLGLNHGEGYGRQYYSYQSRMFLSEILAGYLPTSFDGLYQQFKKKKHTDPTTYRLAFELVAAIESLTHYPQLITSPQQEVDEPQHMIQIDRALEECHVVYFWLPSALESISVREVGKLVLFNLEAAAYERKRLGKELRQVYLLIDECQKVVGENFQGILQKARSSGIATILANQSINDLDTPNFDLRSTIRTNTAVKLHFSFTEPDEIRNLIIMAGKEMHYFEDEGKEQLGDRLSVTDIAAISDHPKRLFLHVSSGEGYTQFGGLPVPVQTDWPISFDDVQRLEKEPWPTIELYTKSRQELKERSHINPVKKKTSQKKPAPMTMPAGNISLASNILPESNGAPSALTAHELQSNPIRASVAVESTRILPQSSSSPMEIDNTIQQSAKQRHLLNIQSFFDEE